MEIQNEKSVINVGLNITKMLTQLDMGEVVMEAA